MPSGLRILVHCHQNRPGLAPTYKGLRHAVYVVLLKEGEARGKSGDINHGVAVATGGRD